MTRIGFASSLACGLCALAASACSAGGSSGADVAGALGGSSGVPAQGGSGDAPTFPMGELPAGADFGPLGPSGNAELADKTCFSACTDFPAAPIFEAGAPLDAAALFGSADAMAGSPPCVLEPQLSTASAPGAMIPANWLRPRFRFTPAGNEDLFEIRLHSEFQASDLVAYTTEREWHVPRELWLAASANISNGALTVTIRGINRAAGGTPTGVRGDIFVAPVNTGGSMVFWATTSAVVTPESSVLRGFSVGDEGVVDTIQPAALPMRNRLHENGRDLRGEYGTMTPGFEPGQVQCVGCHTSTPDGNAVVFTDDYPWTKVVANVTEENLGLPPAYVTPGAQTMIQMPWLGTQTMSAAHWAPGDRVLVASFAQRTELFTNASGGLNQLAWFDLETPLVVPAEVPPNGGATGPTRDELKTQRNAVLTGARGTAWGVLATTGEARHAVTPEFSNDGTTVAYVSTDLAPNGHPAYDAQIADILLVPYENRQGGAVVPLAGASSSEWLEYYPAFSADDHFIAFTRAPNRGTAGSQDGPYYNRNGEIFVVVPGSSATAPVRLSANDPVACSGEVSPGVHNSWPKWSPQVGVADGKRYYFLIFSSSRSYPGAFDLPRSPYTPGSLSSKASQLYMAAIVVDEETQEVTTYPAVYIWNQNDLIVDGAVQTRQSSNLTPAWDVFNIPPVPVPTIIR